MCGRYALVSQPQELAAEFEFAAPIEIRPRYNIAPTQEVPVVRLDDAALPAAPDGAPRRPVVRQAEAGGGRRLDVLRWGLIPHWAQDPKIAYRTINARSETVATQPAFRGPFRRRRCLVPASGFFEWRKSDAAGRQPKQPHYVRRKDGRPMAFAGLWDRWQRADGDAIESFTILTTEANALVRPCHDRMPVILSPEHYDLWLDPQTPIERLRPLLAPCPAQWLEMVPVGRRVNNPRNDDSSCIVPLS